MWWKKELERRVGLAARPMLTPNPRPVGLRLAPSGRGWTRWRQACRRSATSVCEWTAATRGPWPTAAWTLRRPTATPPPVATAAFTPSAACTATAVPAVTAPPAGAASVAPRGTMAPLGTVLLRARWVRLPRRCPPHPAPNAAAPAVVPAEVTPAEAARASLGLLQPRTPQVPPAGAQARSAPDIRPCSPAGMAGERSPTVPRRRCRVTAAFA